MAKARKKANPAAKAAKASRNAQAKTQANPFELKGVRRHFAVVGQDRKRANGGANGSSGGVKKNSTGGSVNVVKARENADLRRKKTLLVEYRQIRRGNAFMDRRLGARMGGEDGGGDGGANGNEDDDPALRALQKLRAQRVRESRRGSSKFALSGGGGNEDENDNGGGGNGFLSLGASASLGGGKKEVLTHGGRPLDEEVEGQEEQERGADGFLRRRRADDEEDERMLDELAREYRAFGGPGLDDEDYAAALEGARQQLRAAEGGDGQGGQQQHQKTRKQVMEEVIAKSKAFKAERARQREADEDELRRLDDRFAALVRGEGGKSEGGDKQEQCNGGGNPLAPLMLRPGEAKRASAAAANGGANKDDADDYDRAARELALAAGRAAPGERTLTAPERQAQERERLEALERARVARMLARAHGGGDDAVVEAAAAAAAAPSGGYAARRKRQRDEEAAEAEGGGRRGAEERRPQGPSGDALEDDFCLSGSDGGRSDDDDDEEDSGDGEGGGVGAPANALEARRRARAAGSDPLQAAFREQAARLAAKFGAGGKGAAEEEEEDDEDEDASGSSEEDEEDEEEAADEPPPLPKAPRAEDEPKKKSAARPAPGAGAPEDLPYTPALPQSPEAFFALVRGRPAEHLALAVERVLAFNSAELAADGRRKTQVFFGVLLAHFARLAGERPLPRAHLDALLPPLAALCGRVPLYAATAARARLERARARLLAALPDPLAAGPSRGWPAARTILTLRLLSLLFPTTDRRHAVATPAAALLGEALARCPVSGPYEAALGCACAGLLVDAYTGPAGRLAPEAVAFYASALRAFVPQEAEQQGDEAAVDRAERAAGQGLSAREMVLSRFAPGCLALDGAEEEDDYGDDAVPQLDLYELLGGQRQQQQDGQDENGEDEAATARRLAASRPFRVALLGAVCAGARGVARVLDRAEREAQTGAATAAAAGGDLMAAAAAAQEEAAALAGAAPEILAPLAAAAAALDAYLSSSSFSSPSSSSTKKIVRALSQDLIAQASASARARRPLVQRRKLLAAAAAGLPASSTVAAAPLAAAALLSRKDYTPRFEQDGAYTKKRSYDPDRERAEAKAARRELARERRGAAREMRRDGAFMAAQRDGDKAQVQKERAESERRFYSELQAFEGDMRSGGQGGMNQHRKKKK